MHLPVLVELIRLVIAMNDMTILVPMYGRTFIENHHRYIIIM